MADSVAVWVRPARPDERYVLEGLQWRASLANPGDRDVLIAHPDAIDLPEEQIQAGQVFVAERSGALCGFAALLDRDDGDLELDGLFVEPGLWRSGVGRRLIEHCAEICVGGRNDRLHVIANPNAEAFYRSCGFTSAGQDQTRFGPASRMVLSI